LWVFVLMCFYFFFARGCVSLPFVFAFFFFF